ncbi:MAG: hypothetical protein LBG52_00930, partial [Candidatus Peribacteria bacterium]|nr:hypothetical protein [Candidatus Peribacteria bacterium]
MTRLIKDISPNFTVIEKDETMKTGLEEMLQGNGKIIMDDVLRASIGSAFFEDGKGLQRLFIVGNLPYYITSPILRKFFCTEYPDILGGLFMIQAEVGEKIARDAKKKSYLYRLLNYAYHVKYLKTVSAKAFAPPPKVKSCLVSLVKKAELPQISFERLLRFLEVFAPYSRKTLGKIAKMQEKREGKNTFFIPKHLAGKRLEALRREELEEILATPNPV